MPGVYDCVQVLGGLLIELLKGKVIEDEKVGSDEWPELLVEGVNKISLSKKREEATIVVPFPSTPYRIRIPRSRAALRASSQAKDSKRKGCPVLYFCHVEDPPPEDCLKSLGLLFSLFG